MIIPASQFLEEVTALGFICWSPRDKNVFCPSSDWLREFGAYLLKHRLPYEIDSWDCDDYSLQAVSEASVACRLAGAGNGHTFVYCTMQLWGPINGVDAPFGSGHACNLVRLDTGAYVFFEPQNGEFCDAKTQIDGGVCVPVNALL